MLQYLLRKLAQLDWAHWSTRVDRGWVGVVASDGSPAPIAISILSHRFLSCKIRIWQFSTIKDDDQMPTCGAIEGRLESSLKFRGGGGDWGRLPGTPYAMQTLGRQCRRQEGRLFPRKQSLHCFYSFAFGEAVPSARSRSLRN